MMKFRSVIVLHVFISFYCPLAFCVTSTSTQNTDNQHSVSETDESTPVLVVLKQDFAATTNNTPSNERLQKTLQSQIANEQNLLLKEVPIVKSDSIKRFIDFPYLALSANNRELEKLRASPHVARILPDTIHFPAALNYSISQIGADRSHLSGYTGAGQTIAILDNGIDKRHPSLQGKIVAEACFSTKNSNRKIKPLCRARRTRDSQRGAAAVKCKFQAFGCAHGTILAAIAAGNGLDPGVAPHANIIAVKADSLIENKKVCYPALRCRVFFNSDLLRGLEFIYRKRLNFNIAAVNASIGGKASNAECNRSPIRQITAKLKAANIAFIAASGNEGYNNQLSSPACVPGVISVGAVDVFDVVSNFSNTAPNLNLLAPGEDISLSFPSVVPVGYEILTSGTSLSAAFVSGSWAILKSQKPSASVDEIHNLLANTGLAVIDQKNTGIIKPRIQIDRALGLIP